MYTAKRTNSQSADFNALIVDLNAYLSGQYGEVQKQYSPHNYVDGIDTVIVIYDGEVAVGCGCFKPYDETSVEIKRMFVRPEYRQKGIGKLIMAHLEQWATELGYTACVLETGDKQPEAVAMYKRVGYIETEKYGVYVNLNNSICMRKELALPQH